MCKKSHKGDCENKKEVCYPEVHIDCLRIKLIQVILISRLLFLAVPSCPQTSVRWSKAAKAPICQTIQTGRQRGYVKYHQVARDKPYRSPVIGQMLPKDGEKLAVVMPADEWMGGN